MKEDLHGALSLFNEALEVYINDDQSNNEDESKNDKHPNCNTELRSSCLDSIGRSYNNIGCVYYKMGDVQSALLYMQKSLMAQRNALRLNHKAESALLSYALTQSNTGYLKCKTDHLDAVALMLLDPYKKATLF